MAKGFKCPNCGMVKFQMNNGPIGECSNCHAVGFWGQPQGVGSGKGRACGSCGEPKLRDDLHPGGPARISYCTGCQAVLLIP